MEEKTPLKILLIADGRSPITHSWIAMLKPLGYRLSLVSSYPCAPVDGVERLYILPLAFSRFGGSQAGSGNKPGGQAGFVSRIRPFAQKIRQWLGPWTLLQQKKEFLRILSAEKPDGLHALRIPFEGMLASNVPTGLPLIISTWGNDFTLHAPSSPRMSVLTRRVMQRAEALISDTQVDVQHASKWGFDPSKPSLVVPGNGGLDLKGILAAAAGIQKTDPAEVINPRGLRSYTRSDTFFKAIPLVLDEHPEVQFMCTSMRDQPEADNWVHKLGIGNNITLLPLLPQKDLWLEFAKSRVSVSVSTHDGTPNTLLEAMATGCFPICGDLPSIREWITPGENGLLVDPSDPIALAKAILLVLDSPQLQEKAARLNAQIVQDRADIEKIRLQVDDFYQKSFHEEYP